MNDAKPWYLSAGVWGAFVTLLGSALSLFKVQLDPALLDDVRAWVLSLVTLVGGAVALYGRLRATRRIGLASPSSARATGAPIGAEISAEVSSATKDQNWRMNAAGPLALLLVPALLAHVTGCASLSSPSAAYVAADRATYDAVAPEYVDYVRNDPALDPEQRERRERTVETWRIRVHAAEATGDGTGTDAGADGGADAAAPTDDVMPERELTPEREVTTDE